jgi:cold shock CspA family protein
MQLPSLLSSRRSNPASLTSRRSQGLIPTKPAYVGQVTKGQIKALVRGQGSGTISGPRGTVFFHKTDVEGRFWDLKLGDAVVFELLEDAISGPRALHVRPAPHTEGR